LLLFKQPIHTNQSKTTGKMKIQTLRKQSLSSKTEWFFSEVSNRDVPDRWFPAQVPGGVHTDLLRSKLIPDPFEADNEKRVQWVAESDWDYRRSFTVDSSISAEEHVFLVCDGLDTLAEVFINGKSLGNTNNMFRQYRWEVKQFLVENLNLIEIRFKSPVRFCREKQAERPLAGVSQAIAGGPYLRKAPCQFGWDWGPMLPPIGIWKDIRLEAYSIARLADVHLRQDHRDGSACLSASIRIEEWFDEGTTSPSLSVNMQVAAPNGHPVGSVSGEISAGRAFVEVEIAQPELWWTNDLGPQPLYQVKVHLLDSPGNLLDRQEFTVGLRSLELRQEDDRWGKSFQFVINGVPVFAKGSNWIPADSFPTRITDESLEHLIRSAADTHQNMLRVWGGGFYEEDRFYDLCDQYGILVWQDFIFSCSIYPLDRASFVNNVAQEVIENIKRIRHRTSLALWCGNNEMEIGWVGWGWNKPENQDLKAAYDTFFHHTLPEWIAELDPDTSYWPSSPSSGVPFENPNSETQGDAHYWDVWHGRKPFNAYRTTFPRFQSEFGFQSLPPMETVKTYAQPQDWNMTSYIMEHHQRSWSGNGLMIGQMTDTFRMPKDFESLIYLSMVLQAEGIRYGVEHWRRSMPRIAGTLYWQLNDCWQVASWSSLDYFGRWKALHYYAKRFFAPVMLSIKDEGKRMEIHVTNDQPIPFYGTVRWRLENLKGETITAGEETVLASPLSNTHIETLDFEQQVDDVNRRNAVFICDLVYGEELLATALATFTPNKHLELENPAIKKRVTVKDNQLKISLRSNTLARFVEVSLVGADVVFSNNYFDIPANRQVTVTCPLPEGWDRVQARKFLQVRSLYDSFA